MVFVKNFSVLKFIVLGVVFLLAIFSEAKNPVVAKQTQANTDIIYFIPGALYSENKPQIWSRFGKFNTHFIAKAKQIYGDNFVVVRGGVPKIPLYPLRVIWSSRWAVLHGYETIDTNAYNNVKRVIEEISTHYQRFGKGKKIHIIGSSYGSVLAAQASLTLLEQNGEIKQIEDLILSASMIHEKSELGLHLKKLHQERLIKHLTYDNDSTDNVVGISGRCKADAKMGLSQLIFGNQDNPSVFLWNKHQHVFGANNTKRTYIILDLLHTNQHLQGVVKH